MAIIDDLLAKFEVQQQQAREANLRLAKQTEKLRQQNIETFGEGGAYGQGVEASLGRARQQSVAQGMQALVSSGLANTTTAATLGRQFEEEVGVPARLRAEDTRYERLAGAREAAAMGLERQEHVGPDYGTIAQLAMKASSSPGGSTGSGGISSIRYTTGPGGKRYFSSPEQGQLAAAWEARAYNAMLKR